MLLLLNAACLGFEILKYIVFNEIEREDIPMNSTIENIYIALTAVTLLKDATYTIFLLQDLGRVPLLCPQTYHYKSKTLNHACLIRMISFFLMWSYTGIFGLSILVEITQQYSCNHKSDNDLENLDYSEKVQGRSFRPLSSTSEMPTLSENNVSRNETSVNGSHSRSYNGVISKNQFSPLFRQKPTYRNSIFSPPSHEPK
ncbi:23535_t:CDS:2 [Dentiscutata erythropus]|uniref:23535_t:CDS:1 n=1 Tax=Dentiscutata erythropus TaxID=1348616 RepID=A0A9N8YVH5_9GLOM|nr:23535_t:CDS:2 [Dentiscutata erythropus]